MPEHISRTELAKRLKRSPRAVISAIARLQIPAAEKKGKRLLYPTSTLETLLGNMRKANRNREDG